MLLRSSKWVVTKNLFMNTASLRQTSETELIKIKWKQATKWRAVLRSNLSEPEGRANILAKCKQP
jgi:hypothetical protein